MEKLFILGNGFDLYHGLKTSYYNFKEYLESKIDNIEYNYSVPSSSIGPKGDVLYYEDEVVPFLINVISEASGDNWSDFEESLGKIDYTTFFDYLPEIYDKEGDIDNWKMVNNNQDLATDIFSVIGQIGDYFDEWIESIDISRIKQKDRFSKLISNTDCLFLNFNYTKTLELIYNMINVCHIHGVVGEKLIIGHGNKEDYYDKYQGNFIGAEHELSKLDNLLKKNTDDAFKENFNFFNSLSDIKEIYSYGFSFSEVDMTYIKKICERIDSKDATWFLSDYNKSIERNEFIKKICSHGFKGSFKIFSI